MCTQSAVELQMTTQSASQVWCFPFSFCKGVEGCQMLLLKFYSAKLLRWTLNSSEKSVFSVALSFSQDTDSYLLGLVMSNSSHPRGGSKSERTGCLTAGAVSPAKPHGSFEGQAARYLAQQARRQLISTTPGFCQ